MREIDARLRRTCAALTLLLCLPIGPALAHRDDGYHHDFDPLPARNRWMATLDDATRLKSITLPGTHGSASRHGGWIVENQTLTIRQQLEAGVRYLDLRAQHANNTLRMHHGNVDQWLNLSQVLDQAETFLRTHPTETVLVRLREEGTPNANTRSFAATLDAYYPRYGAMFAPAPWTGVPLGALRGKLVLLQDYPGDTRFGELNWWGDTTRQDDHHMATNWSLYDKWTKIKGFIDTSSRLADSLDRHQHHANVLSGSGGSFPYFVASGHSDPRTDAPALVTGKTTPIFQNDWPDFPRGNCFLGTCTIFFEGTNTLAKQYLQRRDVRYAGIVAADFPGAGLIGSVIDVNRTQRPMVSASNGQCLHVYGGTKSWSRTLYTQPCNGTANQQLTVRGEQIRINDGQCLDVEGARNFNKARVLAWPCHGGVNQRWSIDDNGTIRSLMPGPPRCLDLLVEEGNRVGLWDCHAPNPDQQFRTRV